MITFDYGRGEGGKKCQIIDYVICEGPLSTWAVIDALTASHQNLNVAKKINMF